MSSIFDTSNLSQMFSALDTTSLRSQAAVTALSSGITLMQQKKYERAAAAFKMATVYDSNNTDAYNYMAQAYLNAGDDKSAISAYKQSLQVYAAKKSTGTSSTTQDQVQVNLANIYAQDNQTAAAINELKAAIKTNPQNTVAPYTLGLIFNQQNQPQEAEKYLRQAVKLSPNDGNAYYGLGLALEAQGKSDEAVSALQTATVLKSNFSAAIYEIGNIFAKNGQSDVVEDQISILKGIDTDESNSDAALLQAAIQQPKISRIDTTANSSFNTLLGTVPLMAIDSQFVEPDATKEVSVSILFDSSMDPASVNNVSNWSIRKAQGAVINSSTGLYDNGAYRSTDTLLPPMPSRVVYDPTTNEATLFFAISQNSSGTGTIDTSGIVFSFNGKDINGKSMDPTADSIDGKSASSAF